MLKVFTHSGRRRELVNVVCLGIGIILCGDVYYWNKGLESGIWSFFVITIVVSAGYLFLATCLGEMTSTVAFPGGAFGYVRCTVGPYCGFLVGLNDLMLNNFYTMMNVVTVARAITVSSGIARSWEPLTCLACYVVAFCLHLAGETHFWKVLIIVTVLTMLLLLVYGGVEFLGHSAQWSFSLVNTPEERFSGGAKSFFAVFPVAAQWYIGIESIAVVGGKIRHPKEVLPIALIMCFLISLFNGLWVYFSTVIEYNQNGVWDDLLKAEFPLDLGFMHNLQVPMKYGPLLTIPPSLAAVFGYLYLSKNLVVFMAKSGMLPQVLHSTYGNSDQPLVALVACTVIQYAVLCVSWSVSREPPFFELCVLGGTMMYLGIFVAYLIFHYKFSSMERGFYSPFGAIGAWLGIVIFAVMFFCLLIFHADKHVIEVYFGLVLMASVYYFVSVETTQFFSPEEQKHFMRAYIVNANLRRKMSAWKRFKAHIHSTLLVLLCRSGAGSVVSPSGSSGSRHSSMRSVSSSSLGSRHSSASQSSLAGSLDESGKSDVLHRVDEEQPESVTMALGPEFSDGVLHGEDSVDALSANASFTGMPYVSAVSSKVQPRVGASPASPRPVLGETARRQSRIFFQLLHADGPGVLELDCSAFVETTDSQDPHSP